MIAQRSEALLAFGSNLGDRANTIRAAYRELEQHPAVDGFEVSPFRETIALTPNGADADAPRYLNAVAKLSTSMTPHELLELIQSIETDFGRERHEQWGDRTLDIDIIVFGGKVITDPDLTVPHPRAHERDFVLAPWLDLEPEAVLIRHGRVAQLLEGIGDTTVLWVEGSAA